MCGRRRVYPRDDQDSDSPAPIFGAGPGDGTAPWESSSPKCARRLDDHECVDGNRTCARSGPTTTATVTLDLPVGDTDSGMGENDDLRSELSIDTRPGAGTLVSVRMPTVAPAGAAEKA